MRQEMAVCHTGHSTSGTASTQWPRWIILVGIAFVALAFVSIGSRPLMPVDETRYATVAWEMWHRGSFWVPYLNGDPYDHKPPGLFWLIHLGWWVGGVSEIWPRWIGPLSTLASGVLLAQLGRRLWPLERDLGALAGTVFLGSGFVALYATMLMFDMPLLACLIVAWIGLWESARRGRTRDWVLFGTALGTAIMVKGPVALVYTLPALLLIRLWRPKGALPLRWRGVAIALGLAVAPAAAWLSLVATDGNASYLHRLLIDQTLQRVAGTLGHQRPWWWYLPLLLLLPLPWLLWKDVWRALWRLPALGAEPGVRFTAIVLGAAFPILSVVHGKQAHYLIPLLALAALLVARALHDLHASGRSASPLPALSISAAFLCLIGAAVQWTPGELHGAELAGLFAAPLLAFAPVFLLTGNGDLLDSARRFAVANALTVLALVGIVAPLVGPMFDLRLAAEHVADAQASGRPVAFVGKYQGEFGFLGRLATPVTELRPEQARAWATAHPDGLLVVRRKRAGLVGDETVEFRQPYKTDELLMLGGRSVSDSGTRFRDPVRQGGTPTHPRRQASHG